MPSHAITSLPMSSITSFIHSYFQQSPQAINHQSSSPLSASVCLGCVQIATAARKSLSLLCCGGGSDSRRVSHTNQTIMASRGIMRRGMTSPRHLGRGRVRVMSIASTVRVATPLCRSRGSPLGCVVWSDGCTGGPVVERSNSQAHTGGVSVRGRRAAASTWSVRATPSGAGGDKGGVDGNDGGAGGGGGGGGGDGSSNEDDGAKSGGRFHFITAGWAARVAADPDFTYKVFVEQVRYFAKHERTIRFS